MKNSYFSRVSDKNFIEEAKIFIFFYQNNEISKFGASSNPKKSRVLGLGPDPRPGARYGYH